LLSEHLTNGNLVEDVKTLPMGSIPVIGKQTLEIEKMTKDIQAAKKSLIDLEEYQKIQLKTAKDRLILMEKTQKDMIAGHKLTHKLKTNRQKAIHDEKKTLRNVIDQLEKDRSSIDDINLLENHNEKIIKDFKDIREKQKELIKINIPKNNRDNVNSNDNIKKLN